MEMTKPITRQQEREILRLMDYENHGKDYKANGFDIYNYQKRFPTTGHSDKFIAFIDEPKENLGKMPKYYESQDIKRVVHWLKKELGAEVFDPQS